MNGLMFPKRPRKSGKRTHAKSSILQRDIDRNRCWLCMQLRHDYSEHTPGALHKHHVYMGPLRSVSEAQGFYVYLCPKHHTQGPEADAAEGAEQEEKPAEIIAPAQIMPEPEQTSPQEESDKADSDNVNYRKAVADAGEKLEEIRQSYEEQNWMRMSEQLLSLGFVVNQLKVMQTMHA